MPKTMSKLNGVIGARLRRRRKELGFSQTAIGDKLGIAFQQIQKYENGMNRISAASLYELSKVLSVPLGYFFEKDQAQATSKKRKAKRGT